MKENIKKQYPFQYYTIRNVDLLEQNGFSFDDYSFNLKHNSELYIGNINGLCCRHNDNGQPMKMMKYLDSTDGTKRKLTFLLPENYRECINGLQGFRRSVLRVLDAESLKDQITIVTYKVDNSDIIDKVKELGKIMKFDVCVMNPPYDGTLHLQILEEVLSFCSKVVNISPANQMFAAKRLLKEHSYVAKSKHLKNNISSVQFVSASDASKVFDAALAGPLMFISYDKTKTGLNYLDYNILPQKLRSIFDKTIRACYERKLPNLADEINKETNKRYVLPCPEVHGNQNCKDWAEITSADYTKALNVNTRFRLHVSFDTEQERLNCYNAWHTQLHQWIHSLIKADNFNYYGHLPWFNDYTQPWTNRRICEFFNITGYVDDNTAKPGSEWEIILNEIQPYTFDK